MLLNYVPVVSSEPFQSNSIQDGPKLRSSGQYRTLTEQF